MKSFTQLLFSFVLALAFSVGTLIAQTADAVRGCPNLEVNFTAPSQSGFFWDFNDGTNSTVQNPSHIFRNAGMYTVTLFDKEGGTASGSIVITIYQSPIINITSTPKRGCIPLEVDFGADLTIDSEIMVNEIKWTFGDGGSDTGTRLTHVYSTVNVFDVSIELDTELPNCNKFQAFEDEITSEAAVADFSVDKLVECDYPADLNFTNNASSSGNSYQWDFGNGQSSSDANPGPVTYSSKGIFEALLVVKTPSGCIDSMTQRLIIGEPIIDIDLPDTLCIGEKFEVVNRTIAEDFDWKFGTPGVRTFQKEPTIVFSRGGLQEVRLRASNSADCFKETVFEVYVDDPDVDFIIDPPLFCKDNLPKTLIAMNSEHPYYIWNSSGDTVTTPSFNIPMSDERDSLYINLPDSIPGTLTVISKSGCSSTLQKDFKYQLAEAWFIPDTTVGLYPLEVTFEDKSTSQHDIVRRYWEYGDGQVQELDPSVTTHTHLYDICGEFWVTLVVEDSQGCVDRSKAVKIDAFCPEKIWPEDPASCNCTPSDNTFCAGYTAVIAEFEPPIYDFHLYTDEERINHCWKDDVVTHLYDRPGVFPIIPISEYEGVIVDTLLDLEFEIEGTKAIIEHSMDCSDPFTYNFRSASLNADRQTWTYNGNVVSSARGFDYTFDRPGEHTMRLTTLNSGDDCPERTEAVTLYVIQPEAAIDIPDQMCDNLSYSLNASKSKDVFASCYKGYLWEFDNQRPRETGDAELSHQFARGHQTVKLTVEDINGCTATASTTTTVYGIEPEFNLDSTTCLPYPKQLEDLSDADTTLVSWNWSFGSTEQNPFYEFTESDTLPGFQDTILVTLEMEDAFGCKDFVQKIVTIEEPNFFIVTDVGSRICTGQPVVFSVLDTAGIINSYDYSWDFGGQGTATGDTVSFIFEDHGRQEVQLTYLHKNGHCEGAAEKIMIVHPTPDAAFITDKDDEEFICPGQITFFSDEELSGQSFGFDWSFGDETYSDLEDPVIEFGVGEHTITLKVTNQLGCADSIQQTITVIGPSADIVADKDALCGKEEVTFNITNLQNVTDYSLDLGDGLIVDNQPDVTHTYEERPTVVTLLLESEEGCIVSDTLPILISEVEAFFEFECGGTTLSNLSMAGTEYFWDFGGGLTSTEESPEYPYNEISGSGNVTLTVTDGTTGCIASYSSVVQSTPAFEMANLFSPNGDGRNDRFKPVNLRAAREEVLVKTFKIYNRWGQLVFDNNSPDGWGGTYDGKLAPPEVYAYVIEMEIPGCGESVQKGNVTLVR